MFDFNNIDSETANLTAEKILSIISEEEIFRYYFPDFKIGPIFRSPFRIDKKPSFGFYVGKTYIKANDMSSKESWNCFQFVMKLHNVNFNDALTKIYNDLRLTNFKNRIVIKEKYVKEKKIIKINNINFDENILNYYDKFDISLSEIKNNNAYNFDKYWIHNQNTKNTRLIEYYDDVRSAYLVEHNNNFYYKIYQPFSKYKWISNIPITIPFGLNTLPNTSDTLIITKSWKDMVFLRKYFSDVVASQNESLRALDIIKNLKYKRKLVFYDNDQAGIEASLDIYNNYGYESITSKDPDSTDITEYRENNGKQNTENFIKDIKSKFKIK